MFTDNQTAILRALASQPDRQMTMSEIGRVLGKAPGVFQRGLNALEANGYVTSQRQANLRLLSINQDHPLHEALCTIALRDSTALPPDIYMTYDSPERSDTLSLAEPPGTYSTSALKLLIIAGPNGSGKTTFARQYLPQEARCHTFINADFIAHGLSPFSPELAAMKAGRLMLNELDDHMAHRRNVAIETTLSGKRYARLIPQWQADGYAVKLIFLSLPSVDLAVARVACRVSQGGHNIPEDTIQRRYEEGRRNFNEVYKALVDAWALYDNSGHEPILIAEED